MYTDASRLQQILKNLLSNAFKFTEQGKVTMRISRVERSKLPALETLAQASEVFAFSVADTGIGIPREKQKLIFEAFQQADGTTSRKYGGTGLGLTISREIARLLGGAIEVESTAGTGSIFTLYLPSRYTGSEAPRESDTERDVPLPPLPKDADFTGYKVLVIDDDMRNIYAITSVLESRKMSVLHAENGRLGLARLKENPDVDLILMDVMMPEMDGIVATQEIRMIPQFEKLPIISLTAKAMKGDREKCLKAGASDYITKPVDPENLLSMIHLWLKKMVEN
jgi:CheY-like chemotaxis protein